MGYQNKRHAAKLFQTESFFIDSANSLERDVFDCLCDMTPDPQNRPPYRDVPDTVNGTGSCHDIVPVPPRCYLGYATWVAEKMGLPESKAEHVRKALKTLVEAGWLYAFKPSVWRMPTMWQLVFNDRYEPDIKEALKVWETGDKWDWHVCNCDWFNQDMFHLHYFDRGRKMYGSAREAAHAVTYRGWVKYLN